MRDSVWESTAEVGSCRSRASGSAAMARARRRRWRWPPESVRAWLSDLGVEAVGQGLDDVVGRGRFDGRFHPVVPVEGGDRGGDRAGEQVGVVVGDEDAAAQFVAVELGDGDGAEPGLGLGVAAEAVEDGGDLFGVGGGDGEQFAAGHGEAGLGVVEFGAGSEVRGGSRRGPRVRGC